MNANELTPAVTPLGLGSNPSRPVAVELADQPKDYYSSALLNHVRIAEM